MNDDTDKPLNTVGDDALEARITAWVLGEASSFEAGELEKLCAADPALGLFERRLRVLHGLVAEDFKAGPAAEWKLATERRAKITDLLGVAPEVAARVEATSGHFARRALLALAACAMIGFISYSLTGGVGQSAKREKSAVAVDFIVGGAGGGSEAPMAMAPADDFRAVEQSVGAPVKKPDTSYAHLGTNSPFTVKPPPASAAFTLPDGEVALQEDVVGDKRKLQAGVEASADGFDRDAVALGVTPPSDVDAKAELDVTSNSLALLKEKSAKSGAAGMPEQKWVTRSEVEGISGPAPASAPAPAIPMPAPAAKPAALAQNEVGDALGRKGEANGRGFLGGGMVGGGGGGAAGGRSAESAPEISARRNTDFISTVDGVAIPGLPAAPGADVSDIVTAGNRSGDGAITRNNIDAILNNPARREKADAKGDEIAALTGAVSDEATAMLEKSVEETQAGAKNGLGSGIASGPEAEILTRNLKPGEPVSGAFGVRADSLADAGGMLLEPEAESRFGRGLQTGGEQTLEQDEATAFGNLEEMGRLSRNRQPGPALRLGGEVTYNNSTGVVAQGIADLTDLAEKQSEALPSGGAVAGRWFGTVTDETTKGLKDTNAPSGATADAFFDNSMVPGKPLGGLKRDVNDEFAPALVEGKDEVLAKKLEQVDRTRERLLPPVDGPVADPAALADPALAVEDGSKVDEVRRKLYLAEGASNLGKYDDSRKAYEEVLRIDPYNKAARRGMEQVAQATADYYRAANDHTRAQLLADVDKAWELSVPQQNEAADSPEASGRMVAEESVTRGEVPISPPTDGASAQPQSAVEDESKRLAEREVLRRNRPVLEFAQLRDQGREAYAKGDYQSAYDKYAEALGKLPDHSGMKGQRDFLAQSLGVAAAALASETKRIGKDVESLEWAGKAVEWDPSNETARRLLATAPTAEISTAAEPFSTFSLHVSDASFKLAQAAMERGEVPAAEGIRPEEFYNAFDYGDPAPASGEPVVCVTEQSAHPAFAQRNLLRIGVRTGSQGRGASTPLNLTLLLDHSGSMEREDRNAGLAMAVRQLSGLLKEGDTITVAGFSRQPRLLADRLPGARAQELNELIERTPSEGGTNLEEGLKLGEELAKRQFNPAAQNRVVLFTDGAANLGDARPEALQARIEGLRQQGIAFDAAGFGADGLNDKLLERLTRNGNGRYYIVDGPEDADAGFAKQLAGAFRPAAENVKVQVRFNPARVARYKLIGFEEHRLQKEDFRNDAVDAAEMAAEEAGNALYQIETLPQGEGEVGEVSVRFRDVASGQMVERTWTIPYDAQAPAFDRATPSIQLAGLAAFTAEKLRAAPMADAVDFQQLGQVYAGVRARYPNSQPVADLGSMIGKMK